jgi:hypothetical protein
MSDKTRPNVSKLLRVLVAGGVTLAGAAGARAEDKEAAPTEKTEKAKDQDKEAEKAKAEKAAKAEKEQQKKKADEAKKAAQTEGEGVKGW